MKAVPEVVQSGTREHEAALRVALACDQHDCVVGECEDINHRRDLHYRAHILQVLGLAD